MDTNAQIISDLREKFGSQYTVDLLSNWKGLPVMVRGHIQEIRKESIVFQVDAPDSIVFTRNDKVLILNDTFIMGIQGRILIFDPHKNIAELGEFIYVDHGFGYRSMVRVEPSKTITGTLDLGESILSCQIVDISLNGFGLIANPDECSKLSKGKAISLKLSLLNQEIEIPGKIVGLFQKNNFPRLAMSFSQNAPNHAIVAQYIAQRRVEIRQEIQAAYLNAIGSPN